MLTAAGCRKVFADEKSGKDALRPELKACHAFLDAGDALSSPRSTATARSLQDLITMVPRTHRHRHQGGPGRRSRPRPGRRTPQRRH
ncbi:recombinase family protein [Streptomyces sp. NPDC020490]|uniref:recombinase family protein n=1 Tax=Streptomyces sp. NPDC020490 TaxID=3365078 RepID=UPI0037A44573